MRIPRIIRFCDGFRDTDFTLQCSAEMNMRCRWILHSWERSNNKMADITRSIRKYAYVTHINNT